MPARAAAGQRVLPAARRGGGGKVHGARLAQPGGATAGGGVEDSRMLGVGEGAGGFSAAEGEGLAPGGGVRSSAAVNCQPGIIPAVAGGGA